MDNSLPIVLVIDDEKHLTDSLHRIIASQCKCNSMGFQDGREAYPLLATGRVAAVFLDWMMPFPGEEVLKHITCNHPDVQVIIMTALSEVQTAVHAMKLGAANFMTKPFDTVRIVAETKNAIKLFEANRATRQLSESLMQGKDAIDNFIAASDAMRRIMLYINGISESRQPVLIMGETGVGKEGIARAVHNASGVPGEFVAVNIAGLDANLITDALFGHKKGAFTGAESNTDGLVAKAENGTLFLDEIGDLSEENQIKLLRLLEEGEYYRIGSEAVKKSNARIIAATNRNLDDLKSGKKFRKDLYYRLAALKIKIPPLRERGEDIPPLAAKFAAEESKDLGKPAPIFTPDALSVLESYDYPGNVRELRNIVIEICTRIQNGTITAADFPPHMPRPKYKQDEIFEMSVHPLTSIFGRFPSIDELEEYAIREAMRITNGNQTKTSSILNMSRPTLIGRLKKMGMS